eukprot:9757871-Heterocapsa_arctica.AAC.1
MDFTHDVCRQKFKLGAVCAVGMHFSKGVWRNTVVPGMFCVASKEVTGSALPALQALKHMLLEKFQLSIATA